MNKRHTASGELKMQLVVGIVQTHRMNNLSGEVDEVRQDTVCQLPYNMFYFLDNLKIQLS